MCAYSSGLSASRTDIPRPLLLQPDVLRGPAHRVFRDGVRHRIAIREADPLLTELFVRDYFGASLAEQRLELGVDGEIRLKLFSRRHDRPRVLRTHLVRKQCQRHVYLFPLTSSSAPLILILISLSTGTA